jgi:endoglucanase
MGFNCVRLPYSLEQYFSDPPVTNYVTWANKELHGLSSMQIFDKVVDVLTTEAGLMVILNNHVSEAQRCCHLDDGSGLWHSRTYSQQKFFGALEGMTRRY